MLSIKSYFFSPIFKSTNITTCVQILLYLQLLEATIRLTYVQLCVALFGGVRERFKILGCFMFVD